MLTDIAAGLASGLLVAAAVGSPALARPQEPPAAREIEVVARRFAFEPARIEVTEGETVRLVVTSADGVHGIGIKKFKVSEEVPRGGHPVVIEFTATAVGEFEILCSEFCGKGHQAMKGRLVVRAREGGQR